jgi:hypothetical protein
MSELKYVLKVFYPTLPKDWKKGMLVEPRNYPELGYIPVNPKYPRGTVSCKEVEEFPDLWEIIEAFRYRDGGVFTIGGTATYKGSRVKILGFKLTPNARNVLVTVKNEWQSFLVTLLNRHLESPIKESQKRPFSVKSFKKRNLSVNPSKLLNELNTRAEYV